MEGTAEKPISLADELVLDDENDGSVPVSLPDGCVPMDEDVPSPRVAGDLNTVCVSLEVLDEDGNVLEQVPRFSFTLATNPSVCPTFYAGLVKGKQVGDTFEGSLGWRRYRGTVLAIATPDEAIVNDALEVLRKQVLSLLCPAEKALKAHDTKEALKLFSEAIFLLERSPFDIQPEPQLVEALARARAGLGTTYVMLQSYAAANILLAQCGEPLARYRRIVALLLLGQPKTVERAQEMIADLLAEGRRHPPNFDPNLIPLLEVLRDKVHQKQKDLAHRHTGL